MPKYNVGDTVFVPSIKLGVESPSYAVLQRDIKANEGRSVRVDSQDGQTVKVASSVVLPRVGIMLLRIGDYASERETLDPLYNSLQQFFRLLVGPEVSTFCIRTTDEFDELWRREHATKRFLVLVSHGRKDGLCFGNGHWKGGVDIGSILSNGGTEVSVLSAACSLGYRAFSQPLSDCACTREVITPLSRVPAAVASQFLQTYFAERLLEGRTERSSFLVARDEAPGATRFRRWRNGRLDQ